jgi:hypothetical protein
MVKMDKENHNTQIFCGVARLPREMASMDPNSYLAIEIAVNINTGVIADVACTSLPVLCERLVHDSLVGRPVAAAFEELRGALEDRYHGTGKRAMLAAVGNAAAAYLGNRP